MKFVAQHQQVNRARMDGEQREADVIVAFGNCCL